MTSSIKQKMFGSSDNALSERRLNAIFEMKMLSKQLEARIKKISKKEQPQLVRKLEEAQAAGRTTDMIRAHAIECIQVENDITRMQKMVLMINTYIRGAEQAMAMEGFIQSVDKVTTALNKLPFNSLEQMDMQMSNIVNQSTDNEMRMSYLNNLFDGAKIPISDQKRIDELILSTAERTGLDVQARLPTVDGNPITTNIRNTLDEVRRTLDETR